MKISRWARVAFAVALVPPLLALGPAGAAYAQAPSPGFEPLKPVNRVTTAKAATSRLAQTDQSLLGRADSTPVQIMIKFDYDSVATYSGGVAGLEATSPTTTGRPLSGAAAEKRYLNHVTSREGALVKELTRRVPDAKVGLRLRTVYGGVAATVPANRINDIVSIKGVVAVQADQLRKPLTDSSPKFIGADTLYPKLGGDVNAGKGVIFGVLDTGAWPEHPSFADTGALPAPPSKPDGTPRDCDFGDNPTTPAPDPFVCTRKLIGGRPFLQTYLSDPARAAAEPYRTARDSNGHGTHTGSTAAGNVLRSAPLLGVDRGPLNGVAPGAYVSVYKVCGVQGCFSSDSAAAVEQAILDGVTVINFSISGGTNPFTDPVELAFLDAYAVGVFVSASAGNEGPGAGTVNHLSPWVTTVAASTQRREFSSRLSLTGDGGATAAFTGASITAGAGPAQVVLSATAPGYNNALCDQPAPAGSLSGKIVACQRGVVARVAKGFNVRAGGAVGMILYNPTLADIETDNHWLPTVHLADGGPFVAYMTGKTNVTGSFTAGQKSNGQADVMAAFSSRGPGGLALKPDVTAPGVQILAGHTPKPSSTDSGPPGELFQAIAGTSMSSPHTAGAAILLQARNRNWSPGQVKSALMTTAHERVLKEDTRTPADPFDYGAGRIDLSVASNPGLTFDESARNMLRLGNDPLNAVHLNLPSVNAPVMPGRLETTRRAVNVTNRATTYKVSTEAPANTTITVNPSTFTVQPGGSVALRITIRTLTATGQQFGKVKLAPQRAGLPALHLPVAFVPTQGDVTLTSQCGVSLIQIGKTTNCTVTAQNKSFSDTTADLRTETDSNLEITAATGAKIVSPHKVELKGASLPGGEPAVPSLNPGETGFWVPLGPAGVPPDAIGDEEIINYDVPAFVYGGVTYSQIGVDSNGYLVVGGGTAQDNECCNLTQIPDPTRPNNVLAPFWTDLTGANAPGIFAALVTRDADQYIVVEWQVNVFGTTSNRHFQVWIRVGPAEQITFGYDPAARPASPGMKFLVGAENVNGSGGEQLPPGQLPTSDIRVTNSAPTPGGSVSYKVTVKAAAVGDGEVKSIMVTPFVPGTTLVRSTIVVRARQFS